MRTVQCAPRSRRPSVVQMEPPDQAEALLADAPERQAGSRPRTRTDGRLTAVLRAFPAQGMVSRSVDAGLAWSAVVSRADAVACGSSDHRSRAAVAGLLWPGDGHEEVRVLDVRCSTV